MSTPGRARALLGRRCLVTGATGFLGRRVVPRLVAAGARVTVQSRGSDVTREFGALDHLAGDMTDDGWSATTRAGWRWDDVVHLAGSVPAGSGSFVEEGMTTRAHARIALHMARAIPEGWGGRVVHASSMTVYGRARSLPVVEAAALEPTFPYALGKVLAEDVWRASGLADCWLLRFPGLFSAERQSGALFHFIRAGLEQRAIRVSAAQPTVWDILHVDDAAEAVLRAVECAEPFCGAMNISYGEVVQLEQIARLVSKLTTGSEVINETRVDHPPFQLDIGLARRQLGWPPHSLTERLEQLVAESRAALA